MDYLKSLIKSIFQVKLVLISLLVLFSSTPLLAQDVQGSSDVNDVEKPKFLNDSGGISEHYKKQYVERLRLYIDERKVKEQAALENNTEFVDADLSLRDSVNKLYIVDGLYRVIIIVPNDKQYPRQPRAFNPKLPQLGGATPAEMRAFFADYYPRLMREYFTESYSTFYEITIKYIAEKRIAFEVLIRDADEYDLLLRDPRIYSVTSIVNKPPPEHIE